MKGQAQVGGEIFPIELGILAKHGYRLEPMSRDDFLVVRQWLRMRGIDLCGRERPGGTHGRDR